MNTRLLPQIATKHGCTLLDVRNPWLTYLKTNNLQPRDLLKDGVHLNDHGNYLLAELVKRHLVHRPDLPTDPWKDLVRDYEVGKDVHWKHGTLELEFDGNRVDVVSKVELPRGLSPGAQVEIDGNKPSEFPGCYAITRPQPGPWSPLALVRVEFEAPPRAEAWTLKVTDVSADGNRWTFQVAGSLTGPDGTGTSDKPFVSTSGRVKIDPRDWFRNGNVPAGYEIKWQVRPLHVDVWRPGLDTATLAQGLPPGKHRLRLRTGSELGLPLGSLRTIRVYRPPVRD